MGKRRVAAAIAAAILVIAAAAILYGRLHYFTASEVDRSAYALNWIVLPYPGDGGGIEYSGSVKLALYIDAEGYVDRVRLLDTTVPKAYEQVALRAFRSARFGPALKWGLRVKSVKKIEVEFSPPAGAPAPHPAPGAGS